MQRGVLLLVGSLVSLNLLAQDVEKKETSAERDSVRYTRLREQFYKRKVTKSLYRLFFNDVYNRKKSSAEVVAIEGEEFEAYEGWTIRHINIRQLNMLGASVHDTNRVANKFQNFASTRLHRNTREGVIRKSMLLFSEGDPVDPEQLKDSERLLRQSSVILDARIIIQPIADDFNRVDVLVLLQDVWPIIPQGSFSGFDNFRAGITNHNVRGWTHSNTIALRWRAEDTLQQLGMRAIYTIPYLGRSFVSAQMGVIQERDLKHQYVRVSRPFLTVETVHAGAAEAGVREIREFKKEVDDLEKTLMYSTKFGYYDLWYGRAFRLKLFEDDLHKRLVVAGRYYKNRYMKRPEVSLDSNRAYWNQSAFLFSFGYSNRNYYRDILIFGFGRTEDVPIGSMMTFTVGRDMTEFGSRGYAGVRFSKGGYLPGDRGYLYGLIEGGSYVQLEKFHQGVLSTTLNYFSPLLSLGLTQLRQFVNFRYTQGFKRDALEYINLTDEYGIRGVFSDQLVGKRRFNAGLETVMFSPGSFLGFRGAPFAFADFGMITNTNKMWKGELYQAYGLGIRLRNENLTFNTIEFRAAYYPNIPTLSNDWRFRASGVTTLRLQDFDMSAPQIVPFR
jgi:hypothetical protein